MSLHNKIDLAQTDFSAQFATAYNDAHTHSNKSYLDLITGIASTNVAALANLSGINTGDETQSTIIAKLGVTPANTDLSNITANAKTNLNAAGIRTVVDTYVNGTSWYRTWSDGWIEQGFFAYISETEANSAGTYCTLLKPFSNTNYTALGTSQVSSGVWCNGWNIRSKTTISFNACASQNVGWINWYACGY